MYQIDQLEPTARLSWPFNKDDSNTKPSVGWPISKIFTHKVDSHKISIHILVGNVGN